MTTRRDLNAPAGSLEAALRDLNSPPDPQTTVPSHPDDPTDPHPGEHTPTTPRAFGGEDSGRQRDEPEGVTLWGRCGYIPSARLPSR